MSSQYSDHFGPRSCIPDSVSLRFEFVFVNGLSFEPILGSFWSHMLRSIPDLVLLRFEFIDTRIILVVC